MTAVAEYFLKFCQLPVQDNCTLTPKDEKARNKIVIIEEPTISYTIKWPKGYDQRIELMISLLYRNALTIGDTLVIRLSPYHPLRDFVDFINNYTISETYTSQSEDEVEESKRHIYHYTDSERVENKAFEHSISRLEQYIFLLLSKHKMSDIDVIYNIKTHSYIWDQYIDFLQKYIPLRDSKFGLRKGDVISYQGMYDIPLIYNEPDIILMGSRENYPCIPPKYLSISHFPVGYWYDVMDDDICWIDPAILNVIDIECNIKQKISNEGCIEFTYRDTKISFAYDDDDTDIYNHVINIRDPFEVNGSTLFICCTLEQVSPTDLYSAFLDAKSAHISQMDDGRYVMVFHGIEQLLPRHKKKSKLAERKRLKRVNEIMSCDILIKELRKMIAEYDC